MERKPQFYILYLLMSFASVGAVVVSPAMPAIGAYFHLSNMAAKGALMIYLLGYALGELPYGPLSNRYGRKIAVFIGAAVASLGAILCVLSAYHYLYWLLMVGLLIMGLGGAVGLGLAVAIISDSYGIEESTRKMSLLTSSFAIMPAIFVVMSSALVHHIGWQSCFIVFCVYAVLIAVLSQLLPHTEQREHVAISVTGVIRDYAKQFKNLHLMICSISVACVTCVVYFYAVLAPFISIKIMKMPVYEYGIYSLLPYMGFFLGSFASARLVRYMSHIALIRLGCVIDVIAAVAMLVCFSLHLLNNYTLFVLSFVLFFAGPFVFANCIALGLEKVADRSNASAVLNFINVFIPFIGAVVFSTLNSNSAEVLPIALIVVMSIAFILSFSLKDKRLNRM